MAIKKTKNTQTTKVQLQQKGADGQLININPSTLAELVKLQDGTSAEAKFNVVSQEIARVEGKVDAEAEKVATLQGKVGNIEADIEAINAKDLEQDTALGQLRDKDSALEVRIDGHDSEISGLKAKDVELEGSIAKNAEEVEKLKAKDVELQGLVEANTEAIATEVARAKGQEEAIRNELASDKAELENKINEVKAAITDKNSNTLVFSTMDEFLGASLSPKVGDLAFVVDVKKAFIYKGADAAVVLDLPTPPAGWVLFDEISTELDLVNYLTKAEAASTYRAKADKIVEGDLDSGLQGKINGKADLTHVASEISRVEGLVDAVEATVAEIPGQITSAVEGAKAELNSAISAVDTKVDANTGLINALTPRVGAVETKATQNGELIEGLRSDLTKEQAKVTDLQGRMTVVEGQVSTNTEDIAELNSDIATVDAKANANELAVNALEQRVLTAEQVLGNCVFFTVIED